MSRSRKKHGIIKDRGWKKGIHNRIFRRVNKQRIKQGLEPKLMKELINPWDVCDWVSRWTDEMYLSDYAKLYYERHPEGLSKLKRQYFNK